MSAACKGVAATASLLLAGESTSADKSMAETQGGAALLPGDNTVGDRDLRFAQDPALSMHKHAPPFAVTALDGQKFFLGAKGGRVVFVDFWATWCGPCNEELPHLMKNAHEFSGQPLVIISIRWDKDGGKRLNVIAKHEMPCIQYRDRDHQLSRQFAVDAIPRYFTIVSDGILTAEVLSIGIGGTARLRSCSSKRRKKVVNCGSSFFTAIAAAFVLRF